MKQNRGNDYDNDEDWGGSMRREVEAVDEVYQERRRIARPIQRLATQSSTRANQ